MHVKESAYLGTYKEDPFFFAQSKVKSVQIQAGGEFFPREKWSIDYEGGLGLHQTYVRLKEALGIEGSNEGIGLRNLSGGNNILAFDLTRDQHYGEFHIDKNRGGNLQMKLEYSAARDDDHRVILMAEFDAVLAIPPSLQGIEVIIH